MKRPSLADTVSRSPLVVMAMVPMPPAPMVAAAPAVMMRVIMPAVGVRCEILADVPNFRCLHLSHTLRARCIPGALRERRRGKQNSGCSNRDEKSVHGTSSACHFDIMNHEREGGSERIYERAFKNPKSCSMPRSSAASRRRERI